MSDARSTFSCLVNIGVWSSVAAVVVAPPPLWGCVLWGCGGSSPAVELCFGADSSCCLLWLQWWPCCCGAMRSLRACAGALWPCGSAPVAPCEVQLRHHCGSVWFYSGVVTLPCCEDALGTTLLTPAYGEVVLFDSRGLRHIRRPPLTSAWKRPCCVYHPSIRVGRSSSSSSTAAAAAARRAA